jgi:hypothetical protein
LIRPTGSSTPFLLRAIVGEVTLLLIDKTTPLLIEPLNVVSQERLCRRYTLLVRDGPARTGSPSGATRSVTRVSSTGRLALSSLALRCSLVDNGDLLGFDDKLIESNGRASEGGYHTTLKAIVEFAVELVLLG